MVLPRAAPTATTGERHEQLLVVGTSCSTQYASTHLPPAAASPSLPSPLCQERVVSLKLFYFDDVTPADYQPPHFVDATVRR